MLGWAIALPVLTSTVPLATLIRLMARKPGRGRDAAREHRIAGLARLSHRAASLGLRDNCLERSLIAFRYLTAAGAAPALVLGAKRGVDGVVEGHVWLLMNGEPVHDSQLRISEFAVVTEFASDGRPAAACAGSSTT